MPIMIGKHTVFIIMTKEVTVATVYPVYPVKKQI